MFYNPFILFWCLVLVLFQIKGKICLCHPALPHQHLASQYQQVSKILNPVFPFLHNPPCSINISSGGTSPFSRNFLWPVLEISLWGLKLQHHSCLFFFGVCSSMQTAPKLPEMRPAVTPMQVEIISFLRAALAVPDSKICLYSLKNPPEEEQCPIPCTAITLLGSLTSKHNRFICHWMWRF